MSNSDFIFGRFHEKLRFVGNSIAVVKDLTMLLFAHFPKRVLVVINNLFLSSIDWDLNIEVKIHDRYPQFFWKASRIFKFYMFQNT